MLFLLLFILGEDLIFNSVFVRLACRFILVTDYEIQAPLRMVRTCRFTANSVVSGGSARSIRAQVVNIACFPLFFFFSAPFTLVISTPILFSLLYRCFQISVGWPGYGWLRTCTRYTD